MAGLSGSSTITAAQNPGNGLVVRRGNVSCDILEGEVSGQ